jgi:hypothetical protein
VYVCLGHVAGLTDVTDDDERGLVDCEGVAWCDVTCHCVRDMTMMMPTHGVYILDSFVYYRSPPKLRFVFIKQIAALL